MARPITYTKATKVSVHSAKARSRLQKGSERRALVDKIIELGGKPTIADLETHYGYDMNAKVAALIRAGWLQVVEAK